MKISRKQIKESLEKQGIESTLLVRKGTLTTKQKKFAESIALGETGAQSYRIAYNPPTANNQTIGNDAYKLKQDPRIIREIEAYSLAIESSKYRTAEGMRGLVLQSLVSVLIDPDSKPSEKIQAAKILGFEGLIRAFLQRCGISLLPKPDYRLLFRGLS